MDQRKGAFSRYATPARRLRDVGHKHICSRLSRVRWRRRPGRPGRPGYREARTARTIYSNAGHGAGQDASARPYTATVARIPIRIMNPGTGKSPGYPRFIRIKGRPDACLPYACLPYACVADTCVADACLPIPGRYRCCLRLPIAVRPRHLPPVYLPRGCEASIADSWDAALAQAASRHPCCLLYRR